MNKTTILGFGLLASHAAFAALPINVADVVITATRFEDSQYAEKPTNLTVIREEDINASPATTLPELLQGYAGISIRDIYGNGSRATVDLRGFGAAGGQNTLVLLDGKRINDIDMTDPQWPAIPLSSISRIEIVRGGGAVLFGAGATGGIINIITKSPQQLGNSAHLSAGYGSYASRDLQGYANVASGNFGANVTASHHLSDGYRDNNRSEQNNLKADFGWMNENAELRFNVGSDRQQMQLPGARSVQPSIGLDEAASDWRGAQTPRDWATRDGNQAALEGAWRADRWEARAGLAYRDKEQHAYYDQWGPLYREDFTKVLSFTPRIKFSYGAAAEHELIGGVDMHYWDYRLHTSNGTTNIGRPINRVSVRQNTTAFYLQDYTRLSPATTLSAGYRSERNHMDARDAFDPTAPGASFFDSAAANDNQTKREHAYELGLRHAFNDAVAAYGKIGRSYRFANVDEIYEFSPTFQHQFQFLKPQTSIDKEIGVEARGINTRLNASFYHMRVTDEIHLDPYAILGNTNLPPLNRYGMELDGEWRTGALALHGSYTLAYAKFTDGVMNGIEVRGNTVPLVSRQKLNLNASWAITGETTLTAAFHAASRQYMDNDEINTFGKFIPGYSTTDIKLSHRIANWNIGATVNNLFDRKYFTYAVRSQFTAGRYALYPLPERNFWVSAEYDFK